MPGRYCGSNPLALPVAVAALRRRTSIIGPNTTSTIPITFIAFSVSPRKAKPSSTAIRMLSCWIGVDKVEPSVWVAR